MSFWYQIVRFKSEAYCEECRERVARRASDWTVVDPDGQMLEAFMDDDNRADYLVRCEACGHEFEIRSPEDVTQFKQADGTDFPARVVVRLS